MNEQIHPPYYEKARIVCASCNSVLVTGSTVPEMRVEVCSQCHPFYTGKQSLVDTAGRVDRFKRILHRRESARASRKKTASKSSTTSA